MPTTKKATPIESVKEHAREMQGDAKKAGRNLWLAGLGVVATAEEQARDVYDHLLSKGEEFENREDTKLGAFVDNVTNEVKTIEKKVEDGIQTSVATVLHRIGVPSRGEIHTLIDRVEKLSKKVDGLRA